MGTNCLSVQIWHALNKKKLKLTQNQQSAADVVTEEESTYV